MSKKMSTFAPDFKREKSMPWWRNGRRGRLKICCQQWREGSSPSRGTHKIITYSNMYVMIFFLFV